MYWTTLCKTHIFSSTASERERDVGMVLFPKIVKTMCVLILEEHLNEINH